MLDAAHFTLCVPCAICILLEGKLIQLKTKILFSYSESLSFYFTRTKVNDILKLIEIPGMQNFLFRMFILFATSSIYSDVRLWGKNH